MRVTQASDKRAVFVVTLLLFLVYLATAEYSNPYGTDAFSNAAQARAFAADQDPILEEFDGTPDDRFRGAFAWFTQAPGGTTSQYPPGAAAWGAVFYLADSSLGERTATWTTGEGEVEITYATPSTYVPAAIAAALSVAIAIGFLGLTLHTQFSRNSTIAAMVTAGLGTGAWSVASDKLWQHGPAMMCISAGTYLASRDRFAAAGVAFAAGVLVRPHTAIVAALIGVAVAVSRRSVREISTLGFISFLGLAVLLAYNNAVFGSYSLSGGYSAVFSDRLTSVSFQVFAIRLVQSFTHGQVGMVWSSPFIVPVIWASWKHRRDAPDWAIGAALGGIAYLMIQYRANRVTGGSGFFSYRYPLEALMAAAPLFAFSARSWLADNDRGKRLLGVTIVLSILAHGFGSLAATNL